MKRSKILFGLYFIAAAVLLLLCGAGVIDGVPALKLTVPLVLAPIFVSGITNLGFVRILLPVCLTVTAFSEELGINHISPWIIIAASILLAIGLNSLVPKEFRLKKKASRSGGSFNNTDPDNIKISSHFGGAEKFVDSQGFTSAVIDCSMSGITLFFDKAAMSPEGAVIYIDAKFSGIEIYVPKEWQVVDSLDCTMSGVTIPQNQEMPLKLKLQGHLAFCGLEVKYI